MRDYFFHFILGLFFCLIINCSLFPPLITVTVLLPAEPFPWEPFILIDYVLTYPNETGDIIEIKIKAGQRAQQIQIPRGMHIPIAAYPKKQFKPAGAIIPHDIDEHKTVRLRWEEGFLSHCLISIYPWQGMNSLNIPAVRNEIKRKSNNNPWLLNGDIFAHALGTYRFTAHHVRLSTEYDIAITDVPAGTWIPENVLDPAPLIAAEGTLHIILTQGIHSFYNPESNSILRISIQPEDISTIISPAQY